MGNKEANTLKSKKLKHPRQEMQPYFLPNEQEISKEEIIKIRS